MAHVRSQVRSNDPSTSLRAGFSRLLVIIEDLHWSDDASLEWLLYFARQLHGASTLLLLTYRDDEIQPALSKLLAALDRTQFADEFRLSRLTRAEVADMLRAIFDLSRPPTPDFLDTLYSLTEGNPLFVEEVLKSLIASGDIFYADGRWDRKPLDELRIPRTIQVAVRQRTDQLSAEAKQLLTLAAVAGRRFDFALLQAITQQSESALLQQVKELMAAQLVVEESAETFAFRHALTREAVYADLLARERQSLHRTLAETIERIYAESLDTHAGDLSYHFYEAGEWAKALAWSRQAGDSAERLYAHEEALHHYARARQCAERLQQTEQLAAIDQAMGDVYFARGLNDRAVENYERALSLITSDATRAALKAKIGIAYVVAEDERGVPYLHAAVDELNPETQTNELARATMMLGRLHWLRSQHTQAIAWYERARQLAEPHGDTRTLGLIYRQLASSHSMLLQLDESMAWAHKAIALGEHHADRYIVRCGYEMLAQCSSIQGQWQESLNFAEHQGQIDNQIGFGIGIFFAEWHRAVALHEQGDLSTALAVAHSLLVLAQAGDNRRLPTWAYTQISMIAADGGDEETARAHAELALTDADTLAQWFSRSEARRALAYAYMQRQEWERAAELFDQCAELLSGTESRVTMLWTGAGHAETAVALGRLDAAAKIIAENLAMARDAPSRHYEAVARRVQGQIFSARKQWREARLAFDEAIATLDELGSRLELARALYQRGILRQAQDAVDAAHADWARARTLFGEMGAKPMLWRTHAALGQLAQAQKSNDEAEREFATARAIVAELAANMHDESLRANLLQRAAKIIPPVKPLTPRRAAQREFGGLTEREREVATLIAQGKSNREIADKLIVSERTITTHVSNILSKLGYTSRAQIAAWAGEKGLARPETNE